MHHWQEETGIYTIVPWLDYTLTDHHVSYCTHERIEGATLIS